MSRKPEGYGYCRYYIHLGDAKRGSSCATCQFIGMGKDDNWVLDDKDSLDYILFKAEKNEYKTS